MIPFMEMIYLGSYSTFYCGVTFFSLRIKKSTETK